MNNFAVRYVAAALLLMALFFQACAKKPEPQENCNFVQNSLKRRVSWENDVPVIFYIHRSVPGEYFNDIEKALEIWNARFGRTLLKLGGWTNATDFPQKDNANIIYWLNEWESDRSFEQARTTIYWSSDRIYEADIRVNAKNFKYFGGDDPKNGSVDLQSLILHELGHALGLAHTDGQGSVMVTTLASATLRREPSDLDLRSLSCEY